MIDPGAVQAAIVAKLKADAALVAWLAARSAIDEIREAQWQGTAFSYPAVRVDLGVQTPKGDHCYEKNARISFMILSYAEGPSSLECHSLANLVNNSLLGKDMTGTGFHSGLIQSDGLQPATFVVESLWRATETFHVNLYGSA